MLKHGFAKRGRKHGLYLVWEGIKKRCNNSSCKIYSYYGGKGVEVCEEWSSDFQKFYDWSIDNGYKKGLHIDRIDGDGNYSPENCRFVTHAFNMKNRKLLKSNNYTGVSWHKATSKWVARIGVDGKRISLGYFTDDIKAAKAYNLACDKYFPNHPELKNKIEEKNHV